MIASRQFKRAVWCCQQNGVGKPVEGYQELIDSDEVDAVYLSLPPSLHAPWSIAAAEAGKHILCEKPLTLNLTETLELDHACRQHGVRWLDATGWLHHQRTKAFQQWIESGALGELGHLSASVSFFEPFQSGDHRLDASLGGGCLLDLGWYVAGAFVLAASAKRAGSDDSPWGAVQVNAHARIESGVSQRITAMIATENGLTATLSCGYDTATRKWMEVAGSRASLICDDFTRPWAERPTRCWIHDATGAVNSHCFEDQQEQQMVRRLIGNDDLRPFQTQAIRTQAILDGIAQSLKTKTWSDVHIKKLENGQEVDQDDG